MCKHVGKSSCRHDTDTASDKQTRCNVANMVCVMSATQRRHVGMSVVLGGKNPRHNADISSQDYMQGSCSAYIICHETSGKNDSSCLLRVYTTMRAEIEFFRDKLKPDSGIDWETPIAHIIPRTPFATTVGDSSLEGAGGFSIKLGFWWHIQFPNEIVQ